MVKYITCNGEKLPVNVSFFALSRLEQETGKGLGDFGESLSYQEPLFFYALQSGFHADKKVFDIKREDIAFMLDECWYEFNTVAAEFFTEIGNQKKVKQ